MLFLLNKAKIISYIIALFTVIVLFVIASYLPVGEGAVQVAANVINQNKNMSNIDK